MSLLPKALLGLALALTAGAATAQTDPPMTFRWARDADSRWIAAEGEIAQNTPMVFAKFIRREPAPAGAVIRFNSPGGLVETSLDLGDMIREAGLVTDVGKTVFLRENAEAATHGKGYCASACAYAYLGGVERRLATGSRYGVHQFHSADDDDGSDESAQWAVASLGLYLAEMGIDMDLLVLAAAAPSQTMHWLDRDTLERIGVVTDVRAPAEAEWRLALADAKLVLRSAQVQKNGSVTEYTLHCDAGEPRAFGVRARRDAGGSAESVSALERGLRRARLHGDNAAGGAAVQIDQVGLVDGGLEIAFKIDRDTLKGMAGRVGEEHYLDFEAPAALSGLVGGLSHRAPISNLGEAIAVLERNCA